MDTPPPAGPQSVAGETPRDVVGVAEALALLKVIGPTWTVANEAVAKFKGLPPLLVQVEESAVDDQAHVIGFRVTNATPHGLYIEGVSMIEPKGVMLQLGKIQVNDNVVYTALPVLVPTQGHAKIKVRFPRTDALLRREPPAVKLRCDYSPLAEDDPKQAVFTVRLRHAALAEIEKRGFGF